MFDEILESKVPCVRSCLAALGFFFFSSLAVAETNVMNSATHCLSPGVYKISLPIYSDQEQSPRFTYSYRRFAASVETKTTVIILPGGPGDTLLEHSPTERKYPYGAVS